MQEPPRALNCWSRTAVATRYSSASTQQPQRGTSSVNSDQANWPRTVSGFSPFDSGSTCSPPPQPHAACSLSPSPAQTSHAATSNQPTNQRACRTHIEVCTRSILYLATAKEKKGSAWRLRLAEAGVQACRRAGVVEALNVMFHPHLAASRLGRRKDSGSNVLLHSVFVQMAGANWLLELGTASCSMHFCNCSVGFRCSR